MRTSAFPLICLALLCLHPAPATELHDVEFARPAGVSLTLDANIPDAAAPQPAVLLVHGGGWEAGDKRTYIKPWFTTLTEAGIAWFTINYRLAPQWKHPAAVPDIGSALIWIRSGAKRMRIDPKRIAIMGESAGGHLAALAALKKDSKIAALVSFYGVHDLPLWFQQRGEIPQNIAKYLPDTKPETLLNLSPSSWVKRDSPPMLLVHGTADKGVPHEQSVRLCKLAEKAGARCELFLIEGAPHGVESWERDARFQVWKPKVVSWLRAVLGLL
jgi:alpha-L-fucosidase 2